jgi:acetyl esterase
LRQAANPPRNGHFADRVARTEDRMIEGPSGPIPIRLYWPKVDMPRGVLVYAHGGGFVAGGLETVDGLCSVLTDLARCVTVSVDYRLAPEHRFPAGLLDVHAALQWTIAEATALGAPRVVAVGGDSAGGTLVTLACQIARDREQPQAMYQLLLYPGINLDVDTPERNALARQGYMLTPELIDWLNSFYCARPDDFEADYCAPIRSKDLSRLPPALLMVGEFDPLRYEVETYGARLRQAGVRADFRLYHGAIHGFIGAFLATRIGRQALKDASAALRAALEAAQRQVDGSSAGAQADNGFENSEGLPRSTP